MFRSFSVALLVLGWLPMLIGVRRQGLRGTFGRRPQGARDAPSSLGRGPAEADGRDLSGRSAARRAPVRSTGEESFGERLAGRAAGFIPRLDRILLLLTWVACVALTAVTVYSVWHSVPGVRIAAGIVLFLAGIGAWVWGRGAWKADFAQVARAPAALVTRGPYRVVRHPLYLSTLLAAGGQALAAGTRGAAALWSLLAVVLVWRARREERLLETAFGNEWRDYARRSWGFGTKARRRPM